MENPTNLEFKKIFDNVAENFDEISSTYTRRRRTESLEIDDQNKILLEVGAGTGIITEYANHHSVCSDISFEMCVQAKIRKKNIVCCDAECLPFKKESFDTIISSEMIYYLKNPRTFLSQSFSILKNNGELKISLVNEKMKFIGDIRKILQKLGFNQMYFDDKIKNYLNESVLLNYLNNESFKIRSTEKIVIFPFKSFHYLNKILEKTKLNHLCLFIIINAIKN